MENIKFSIVIPVYNVEQYLERCVESVEAQNYENIEVILVDDGSKDSSSDMCDRLAEKYSNICVYHKENGGLSDARNYGIDRATGDYIIFLDSDDYISETTCKEFSKVIENAAELPDLAVGNMEWHIGDERKRKCRYLKNDVAVSGEKFLLEELSHNTFEVQACTPVYRRAFLNENEFRFAKGILHEDEEFIPRVFLKAENVISTDIVFYHYVIRENSITTAKNKMRNAQCIFAICKELDKLYDTVESEELKKLLKTHSAKICFKAIEDARLYEKANRHEIDMPLLKRSCYFRNEKIRYLLLRINPRLLHGFSQLKKVIRK